MTKKYSSNDIIDIAIQIEQRGHDFYNLLYSKTKKENLRSLFKWLASEEQRHILICEELRNMFSFEETNHTHKWEDIEFYFNALLDSKIFPDAREEQDLAEEIKDEIGAIHIAISFEKDNILYFQEIKDLIKNNDKGIIAKLINEEKQHIMKLLDIKKKI